MNTGRRWAGLGLSGLLLVVALVPAPAGAAAASPANNTCSAATELRERLEGVTEGVIDGRLAAVPRAAERSATWWLTHRAKFDPGSTLDTLMQQLVTAAHRNQPRTAASLAVKISSQSFAWCPAATSDADALMLLDLAGMTGWLRGRGQTLEWPSGVKAATDTLVAHLVLRRHPGSAQRLRDAVAATLAEQASNRGDVVPATHLLELIDQLEQVLR